MEHQPEMEIAGQHCYVHNTSGIHGKLLLLRIRSIVNETHVQSRLIGVDHDPKNACFTILILPVR